MKGPLAALAIALLAATSANAQMTRFTGSGIADTKYLATYDPASDTYRHDLGGVITFDGEYADDLKVFLSPTWDFDISTDGQSVTIHEMKVSYNGTLQINPLVSLELSIEATIADVNVDVNPSASTVFSVQEHAFTSMDISGVYHGIGLTQPFSGSLPDRSGRYYETGYLDFASWPTGLAWEADAGQRDIDGESREVSREYRTFLSTSSDGWISVEPYLHIRMIQVWEPISVTLLPAAEPSADFDSSGLVDGGDFLTWQRGHGITVGATHEMGDADYDGAVGWDDLEVWQTQYGNATPPVAAFAVPEPASVALLLTCLVPALVRRRG
jgi:hypothetical protein